MNMKRDLDLSRKLLLAMEGSDVDLHSNSLARDLDQDESVVAYHILLLKEAGLVQAAVHTNRRGLSSHPDAAIMQRLTHVGHEFIEAVRSDTFWNRLKQYVAEKGLEVTIDTARKAIPGLINAALEG